MDQGPADGSRQRIFNLPVVVLALIAAVAAVHILRVGVLSAEQSDWLVVHLAFFTAAFSDEPTLLPPGAGGFWTFVSYALLHGSYAHLILNGIWLAAFGSPLAWRFGALRFLLFSVVTAAAGAGAFLLVHPGEDAVLVGASAALSGYMAATSRFLFLGTGPFMRNWSAPAMPLSAVLTDRRTLAFIGVWFAINLISGLTGGLGAETPIAWEAHIGGFVAGLLLFPIFDPPRWPKEASDRRTAGFNGSASGPTDRR
jgi:membrane associated rhomboid family serine protease